MRTKSAGKVWIVEVRMENTRESVATARFETIEEVAGELGDAEQWAQQYIDRRAGRASPVLEWIDGTNGRKRARYAITSTVSFRITEG